MKTATRKAVRPATSKAAKSTTRKPSPSKLSVDAPTSVTAERKSTPSGRAPKKGNTSKMTLAEAKKLWAAGRALYREGMLRRSIIRRLESWPGWSWEAPSPSEGADNVMTLDEALAWLAKTPGGLYAKRTGAA